MLIDIRLKDYTTFINETILDFKATNYKILSETNETQKVLKGALFIGTNASGKTQVLNAIKFLLDLLLDDSNVEFLDKKSMYTRGVKYSLGYTFLVDGDIIKYEIGFNGNIIDYEKLFLNDELIVDRIKNNGVVYFSDNPRDVEVGDRISILKQEYYKTNCDNHKIINKWFKYLENSMYYNCLTRTLKTYNSDKIKEQVLEKYIQENDGKVLNSFIEEIGYNSEIVIDKKFNNKDDTFRLMSKYNSVGIKKKGTDIAIPLLIESTGNKLLTDLILPFIYTTNNDGLLILDEFSSGLHNELEESLIRYFFDNSKKSQIFIASHSTNLLDTTIFRPDQIYALDFDYQKGTIVSRLSDENPRESQNLEKMYLGGVFGGKPTYSKEFKDK